MIKKKRGMHSDLLPEFFIISRRLDGIGQKHCFKNFLKQEIQSSGFVVTLYNHRQETNFGQ